MPNEGQPCHHDIDIARLKAEVENLKEEHRRLDEELEKWKWRAVTIITPIIAVVSALVTATWD